MRFYEVDDYSQEEEYYYSEKMIPAVKRLFKSLYPDAKVTFHEDGDDYLAIATADGEFKLSIGVSHQYGDNVVSVAEVYSGQYKGIVGRTVQAAFQLLQKKYPDANSNVLNAQHDVSDGYWPKLAAKLGVSYDNTEW